MSAHHDHSHDHAHGAHAGHGHTHSRKRMALALGITLSLAAVEAVGGWYSHSRSLTSDAGHLFTDALSQVLVLVALVMSQRPSDSRRTYGWHRLEILSALGGGLLLVGISLALLYGGWQRLSVPVTIEAGLMTKVAAVGLVANLVSVWLLHGGEGLNMRSAYLHVLADASSAAAVLVAGVVMAHRPGLSWLDGALTMVIAVVIGVTAWRLVKESVLVLLEAVPPEIDLAGVTSALDTLPGVFAVHDLHVWSITSGRPALSAHIVVDPGTHDELLQTIQRMLRERFAIDHSTLQLETRAFDHHCHTC